MPVSSVRRTVVPWFSLVEWDATYKNIYSDDTEKQFAGYERLLLWKARCPRLPIGVECTFSVLQVYIKDQQLIAQSDGGYIHPYQEYELRLLYSTSIMRFLNQIAKLTQKSSDTLYNAARKMFIPDWLVGLRHDTAHGSNLPPLLLLRKAAQFSLKWLHEYYWKAEAETLIDCIVPEAESDGSNHMCETLKKLIEVWQALKLYSLSDYKNISQIPDISLRKFIRKLNLKKKAKDNSFTSQGSLDNVESDESNDDELVIKSAVSLVKDKIVKQMRVNKNIPGVCEEIVNIILSSDVFIPPAGTLELFNRDNDAGEELPFWLKELWESILSSMNQHLDVLPVLLQHLVQLLVDLTSDDHRQHIAALWMRELCLACRKAQLILQMAHSSCLWTTKDISEEMWRTALNTEVENRPELKNVMTLRMSEFPEKILSMDDVRRILLSPNKWTNIFLTEMLELIGLPENVRERLTSVVSIYTGQSQNLDLDPEEDTDQERVYTVSDLENVPAAVENASVGETVEEIHSVTEDSGCWKRSDDSFEWDKCALGILPWQKDEDALCLDFDAGVSWQPSEPSESEELPKALHSSLPKKIVWEKVLKKRIKKGRIVKRKRKMNNVLKNAFQLTYNK